MRWFLTLWLPVSLAFGGGAAAEPRLQRLATVPPGAEVAGLFMTPQGDLLMNMQHPRGGTPPFDRATVGIWRGAAAAIAGGVHMSLPSHIAATQISGALGSYQILAQASVQGVGLIVGKNGHRVVSDHPDFNAWVPLGPEEGYLFTNWEEAPGGISRLRVKRTADGYQVSEPMMLDLAAIGGIWNPCFGTLTPWGTPLTAEELFSSQSESWYQTSTFRQAGQNRMTAHLGRPANAYDYGYVVEITDPTGAQPRAVKRLAMGRFSHENAVIMPDRRTVYLSDDDTDGGFYKFIADRPNDLSTGTLYAAKLRQRAPTGAEAATTSFDLQWIQLAHGHEEQIRAWVRAHDGKAQNITDAEIADWAAGRAPDDRVAFLETRKAARAKGATTEFRKAEGVNLGLNKTPALYLAIAEVTRGMADKAGDIQLAENRCGLIYRLPLSAAFDVNHMEIALAGQEVPALYDADLCSTDHIAGPDNLVVLADGTLLIAEDTDYRRNAMLWAWRP